jgi:hypothetical protein
MGRAASLCLARRCLGSTPAWNAPARPTSRSDDPTIFAWDIANELRCEGDATYRKVSTFVNRVRTPDWPAGLARCGAGPQL